jgi:hypothetical protein
MIPVLVGSVTHSALQVYLERVSHGQFSGSFLSFVPEYFRGVYLGIGMPGNFAFHGMHLWYLLFLFLYSLLCYHLFIWLKGSGRALLDRITKCVTLPGMLYVGFSLPLLIMRALLPQAVMEVGNGGWGFLYYLWFLIAGFVIVSSDRIQQQMIHRRWISLTLGTALSAAHLYQLFSPSRLAFPAGIADWGLTLLSFFSAWCWLFTILGFGMRHLAVERPFLRSANESVMPFYILHQTVLLWIGYFVMSWPVHDTLKWVAVFISSFIVITALCSFFIRKFELLRFLFGMKTAGAGWGVFRKKTAMTILPVMFVGLIVFSAVNMGRSRSPMPLTYDAGEDILLDALSISDRSARGIRVVTDADAAAGRAIEFVSGDNERAESRPEVYVEMRFSAPAGRYMVWLRGKTNIDNGYTDSVWVQVDDQIGKQNQSARMGNWLDVHPAGVYGWAGDTDDPVAVVLKHTGDHTLRIQPRQTPHRIDQIWLSRFQHRIPHTREPIQK